MEMTDSEELGELRQQLSFLNIYHLHEWEIDKLVCACLFAIPLYAQVYSSQSYILVLVKL